MKIASVNTLPSVLPWANASMDTFSAPPISLLVALGLLTLLAYKSWLSYEQEKVRTRENFSCDRLDSFRSIRNFVVWSLRRVAHVLGYGLQNGPGVLIFWPKRFGTARIVRYASSSTRYRSFLARPMSKDFVGYSNHHLKLSSSIHSGRSQHWDDVSEKPQGCSRHTTQRYCVPTYQNARLMLIGRLQPWFQDSPVQRLNG